MARTIEYNVKVDTGQSVKTLSQLENELAQINEELQNTAVGSDRFKELASSAQNVSKEVEKINDEVEGFTADKKFQAADGAIKLAAGSLQGFVGGLGLLGVESEALGEFEEKAASAIAVGMGFKDISEGIGQLGPAFAKSGIAAKLFGNTTRTAITATGVGVFVIALGAVVANWDKITSAVKNFANSVPFLSKSIEVVKTAFNDLIERFRPVLEFFGLLPDEVERANQAIVESNEEVIKSTEREIALLQAKGATQKEIFEAQREQLQAELDNLKRNEADKEEIYEKETELLVLVAKEQKRIADERSKLEEQRTQKQKEEQEKRKAQEEKALQEEQDRIQKELELEEDRQESISDILLKFREKQRDIEAESEIDKINLEEERQLQELERLRATEEEKDAIRQFYEERRKEQRLVDEEEEREKQKEKDEFELQQIEERLEKEAQLEQEKINLRKQSLQTLSELFGQETALGKAALIAKQAILLQELIINAKSTLGLAKKKATEATLEGVSASSAIASGAAKTVGSAPFPANIPLLIGYAATAAGIISSVKQAVSKTKAVAGQGGGGDIGNIQIPTPSASIPSTQTVDNPLLNNQLQVADATQQRQQPIQAYVISGDVSNAQQAEAKIRNRRRVGG